MSRWRLRRFVAVLGAMELDDEAFPERFRALDRRLEEVDGDSPGSGARQGGVGRGGRRSIYIHCIYIYISMNMFLYIAYTHECVCVHSKVFMYKNIISLA